MACGVEHCGEDAQYRHQQHELERALLAAPHEEAVHQLRRQAACARPEAGHEEEAVHLELHSTGAAHKGQAERKEIVDHKCLVAAHKGSS